MSDAADARGIAHKRKIAQRVFGYLRYILFSFRFIIHATQIAVRAFSDDCFLFPEQAARMILVALSAAFLLSFIPAWIYAYIVYWFDRFEREPKKLLVAVFLWGALFATMSAAVAQLILQAGVTELTHNESFGEFVTLAFFAPLTEESLKGIAILLVAVMFWSEFDSVLDGIVYAGIVALGFAATENFFYLISAYDEKGWGFFFMLFVLRVILTGWNHVAFTAFIGIGIAVARLNTNWFIKIAVMFIGWLMAVALHGTYNALVSTENGAGFIVALCVSWTGWLTVLAVLFWAITRDRARMRLFLRDEVERGAISPAQYEVACSAFTRSMARFGSVGSGSFWQTRRFYQVCAELAQKKEQLQKYGDERGNRAAVEKLRAELAHLASVAKS